MTFDFASVRQGVLLPLRNDEIIVGNRATVVRNFRYEIPIFTHGKDGFERVLPIFWPNLANPPTLGQGIAARLTSHQRHGVVAGNGH
jgi:hypothetical protein